MEESEYNKQIEQIAKIIENDNISPDEQDTQKLAKYKNQAIDDFQLNEEDAMQLVYESLLYLKIKNSDSVDPLQKGDQFGAGFS